MRWIIWNTWWLKLLMGYQWLFVFLKRHITYLYKTYAPMCKWTSQAQRVLKKQRYPLELLTPRT